MSKQQKVKTDTTIPEFPTTGISQGEFIGNVNGNIASRIVKQSAIEIAQSLDEGTVLTDTGETFTDIATAEGEANRVMFVGPGTFGGFSISSVDSVFGSGMGTVIDGGGSTAITISEDYVQLQGLNIQSPSGQCVDVGLGCLIEGCNFSNASNGIAGSEQKYIITNNNFDCNDTNINLRRNGVISNNFFGTNATNSHIEVNGRNVIDGNIFQSAKYCIIAGFDTVVTNNVVDASNVTYAIQGDSATLVSSNMIKLSDSDTGIYTFGDKSSVTGNLLVGSVGSINGIEVTGNESLVVNNYVEGFSTNITASGTDTTSSSNIRVS